MTAVTTAGLGAALWAVLQVALGRDAGGGRLGQGASGRLLDAWNMCVVLCVAADSMFMQQHTPVRAAVPLLILTQTHC